MIFGDKLNDLFIHKLVKTFKYIKNYKLDGSWKLGELPFITVTDKEIYNMSNLGTWKINTHGTYQELATLINKTMSVGYIYAIQPIDSKIYIRIGTEGKGFKVTNDKIFQFNIKEGDVVYICTPHGVAEVNIDQSEPDSE